MKLFTAAFLGIVTSILVVLAQAEGAGKQHKLKHSDYAAYFPIYSPMTNAQIALSREEKRAGSALGTRELVIDRISDPKASYEQARANIVILEGKKPKCRLAIKGFKNLDADWVTEDLVKVEMWPASTLQLVEILHVETGQVVYRAATRHIAETPAGRR